MDRLRDRRGSGGTAEGRRHSWRRSRVGRAGTEYRRAWRAVGAGERRSLPGARTAPRCRSRYHTTVPGWLLGPVERELAGEPGLAASAGSRHHGQLARLDDAADLLVQRREARRIRTLRRRERVRPEHLCSRRRQGAGGGGEAGLLLETRDVGADHL